MQILLTALWLGILTSISPCPLTTNIAAISFLNRKMTKPYFVFLNGVFYTIGRTAFYTIIGVSLSYFFNMIPVVSDFLQTKIEYIAGPIMIILGIILLDIIKFSIPAFKLKEKTQDKLNKAGFLGSFAIGFLFAMMLCPVSAAFFFSNLIQSQGNPLVLMLYGIGTGLPVLIFAFVLSFCAEKISKTFKMTTNFEKYARLMTAGIFIIVGFYYTLRSIL